jgi:protein-L-isoaspartate(D-aspartate) O-methyltransferase
LTTVSTAPELRRQLVEHLTTGGWLRSPGWRAAFADVPREVFLPRFYQPDQQRGGFTTVDHTDPHWLELVYRDAAWTTQLDGDDARWEQARLDGHTGGTPTSSSSMPGVMARMLEALDINEHDRVLELGTGTGYNAAILCHHLGSDQVTSLDIDDRLVKAARVRLTDLDYFPELHTVDGDYSYHATGPYDRLLCTYAVPAVPREWLRHLRPGGHLLTHLHRGLPVSLAVRLTVNEYGNATGRFLDDAGTFMASRTVTATDPFDSMKATTDQQGTLRDDAGLNLRSNQPWLALAAARLSTLTSIEFHPTGGELQEWIFAPDGSWACHNTESATVEQYGPRRLWNEIESIHDGWSRRGQPPLSAYVMSVGSDGGWCIRAAS